MDTALGLLGVAGFIVGMLLLSAGVTYAVVRVDALIRGSRVLNQRQP
jgi:putative effector of murein hydrolase LrgA (UPF0299 family)